MSFNTNEIFSPILIEDYYGDDGEILRLQTEISQPDNFNVIKYILHECNKKLKEDESYLYK